MCTEHGARTLTRAVTGPRPATGEVSSEYRVLVVWDADRWFGMVTDGWPYRNASPNTPRRWAGEGPAWDRRGESPSAPLFGRPLDLALGSCLLTFGEHFGETARKKLGL